MAINKKFKRYNGSTWDEYKFAAYDSEKLGGVLPSGYALVSHTHAIGNVVGLQGALDGKLSLTGGTLSGNLSLSGAQATIKGTGDSFFLEGVGTNPARIGLIDDGSMNFNSYDIVFTSSQPGDNTDGDVIFFPRTSFRNQTTMPFRGTAGTDRIYQELLGVNANNTTNENSGAFIRFRTSTGANFGADIGAHRRPGGGSAFIVKTATGSNPTESLRVTENKNLIVQGTITGNGQLVVLNNDPRILGGVSAASDTGTITNTNLRQVNVSVNSRAHANNQAQVNASLDSTASGLASQVNAARDCQATATQSQVNASAESVATAQRSQINASRDSEATALRSQVNASQDGRAKGEGSQVNASNDCEVSDTALNSVISGSQFCLVTGQNGGVFASRGSISNNSEGAVIASRFSVSSGNLNSFVAACNTATASGNRSAVFTSLDSNAISTSASVMSSTNSTATNVRAMTLASIRTRNNTIDSIAGGSGTTGGPSTANRKWHIFSNNGNIQIAGTLSSNVNFSDFAELFPNKTKKAQGYGLLQTLDGYGVRPAQEGEKVIGVVSATAGVLLNDTSFHWQGRYMVDEWGAPIMEEIPDPNYELEEGQTEQDRPIIKVQKENPDWNPELEQVSRKERPDEWTVVGLTGQVYVRLGQDVKPGDYVKAWKDGIGQSSKEETNLVVMKITQKYDKSKGYAIGFCLIK